MESDSINNDDAIDLTNEERPAKRRRQFSIAYFFRPPEVLVDKFLPPLLSCTTKKALLLFSATEVQRYCGVPKSQTQIKEEVHVDDGWSDEEERVYQIGRAH